MHAWNTSHLRRSPPESCSWRALKRHVEKTLLCYASGVFNASEKAAGDKLTRGRTADCRSFVLSRVRKNIFCRNQGTNTVKYSYVQALQWHYSG